MVEKTAEIPTATERKDTQETYEKLTDSRTVGEAAQVVARLKMPNGMCQVYNRLPKTFEKMFDGRPYKFEANSTMVLPQEIADFLYRTSVVLYEPETGQAVRALVTQEDPDFGVPYVADLGPELLSREVTDNYIQRGTNGVPTKARVVVVKGGGYDQGRPVSQINRV